MISHPYKCIFIHIPKNAGASIEKIIWPTVKERTEENLWMGFKTPNRNAYQTGALQHLFAQNVRKAVGQEVYDQYFSFSIVRNPWDKVVSQFLYLQKRSDLRRFLGVPRHCSFREYLARIVAHPHVHWQPQSDFLVDANDEIMVDYIGRFERYEATVRYILEKIKYPNITVEIPHRNKSKRDPYWMYYTAETIAIVADIYAKDIERFDYHFDWDAWKSRRCRKSFPVPKNYLHSKYVGAMEAYGKWRKKKGGE